MAGEAYADSSFLVSLYRRDSNQPAAEGWVMRQPISIGYSPLARIELRHSLRRAAAGGQITMPELREAFRQIEGDLGSGLLAHLAVNWTNTFRQADELSERYASESGLRAIDLIHVAIAVEEKIPTFLSFDARQKSLAAAAGLLVKP